MAQHIPIDLGTKDATLKRLVDGVRYDTKRSFGGLRSSLKYERLPDEYLEGNDTAVFTKHVRVPVNVVAGGQAILEVHMHNIRDINAIYLVA